MMLFVKINDKKICFSVRNRTTGEKKIKEMKNEIGTDIIWMIKNDADCSVASSTGAWQEMNHVTGAIYKGHLF